MNSIFLEIQKHLKIIKKLVIAALNFFIAYLIVKIRIFIYN